MQPQLFAGEQLAITSAQVWTGVAGQVSQTHT